MKPKFIFILVLITLITGCESALVYPADCVGSYTYVDGENREPGALTLKSDGTYISKREMPDKLPRQGQWEFMTGENENMLLIGHSSFSVHKRGQYVRIAVDIDLGQWFEKGE